MTIEEAQDVTGIFSVADQLPSEVRLLLNRLLYSPQQTTSPADLIADGKWPYPGEISLTHLGVLNLDELLVLVPASWRNEQNQLTIS